MQLIYDKTDGFIHSYDHPDSLDLSALDNVIVHTKGSANGKRVKLADKSLVSKYDLNVSINSGRTKLTIKTAYRGSVDIVCTKDAPALPTQGDDESDGDFETRLDTARAELDTFTADNPPIKSTEDITTSSQEVSLSSVAYKDSVTVSCRLAKAPVSV